MNRLILIFVLCFLTQLSANKEAKLKQPKKLVPVTESNTNPKEAGVKGSSGKSTLIRFRISSAPGIRV